MPFEVLSSLHLNCYSFFLVFLALSAFIFCLQINDYLSLYDQLFSFNFEGPSDTQADPFFEAYSHSSAFASTGRMNASDLANGSSIVSWDDNGTEFVLRGLLTDLGEEGR